MKTGCKFLLVGLSFLLLAGCVTPPPRNIQNICSIFQQYPKWYWAAKKSQQRWGVPVAVQMAIIYQESRFRAKAKPPRKKILWVIPWFTRVTSARGYSQALDGTWKEYERSTGDSGSRSSFKDVANFIGWYGYRAHRRAGIPRNNAYELYLAYHEGIGGYKRRTYLKKRWLIRVARKVEYRARLYQRQLNGCRNRLKRRPWWHLW